MTKANELLTLIEAQDLTDAPVSGPKGTKAVSHGDGLTKKKALEIAKDLRANGTFASVFPSKKFPKKRVVISWEK